MAATSFTKADVRRAVEGATEAGFVIGTVEVTKDGTIRILPPKPERSNVDDQKPEPW